jgi:hypothetical protein
VIAAATLWLISASGYASDRWSCESDGFRVDQSREDIVAGATSPANPAAEPAFSARTFAAAGLALARRELEAGEANTLTMERKLSIVSLVGPLLALRDEAYVNYSGTAHPGGETRFWTIDLRRGSSLNLSPDDPFSVITAPSGRLLDLRQLFTAADIRAALAADPFVRRMVRQPSGTLDELVQDLADSAGSVGGACFAVPADLLSRFAIVGLEPAGATVRIGLPGSGPCRYSLTQLGLQLVRRGPIAAVLGSGTPLVCRPPAGTSPLDLAFSAHG